MDGGCVSVQVRSMLVNAVRRKFRLEWNIVVAVVANEHELFDPSMSRRVKPPLHWTKRMASASTIR